MRSFWSDPYLWIHLAGLAALPVFLELCLLGLATGDPLLPPAIEVALVALIGVTPVLWMQWQRPFSIFSLVAITLKSEQLSSEQRQLLSLFKAQEGNRVPIVLATIAATALLWWLYKIAPIAAAVNPLSENGRLLGLLIAGIAFFGCNLFLQVPLSVVRVLLTSEEKFAATAPYSLEQIPQDFTLVGLPVNQILPTLQGEAKPARDDTPSVEEVSLPPDTTATLPEPINDSETSAESE
jgi:hypothetical protein